MYKRQAILMTEVIVAIVMFLFVTAVVDFSMTTYYSAQLDQRKIQCDTLDRALEGYAAKHLAIKEVTQDKEGKEQTTYQKTYPATLEDLEQAGYINHFADMDEFRYTPHEEITYGKTTNYTYYTLEVKIPGKEQYYTSPGSIRSKNLSED